MSVPEEELTPSQRRRRAQIRQSSHDFLGALSDLDIALKADPRQSQAWLQKGAILIVLGRYEEAKACAVRFLLGGGGLASRALIAQVASFQRNLSGGQAILERSFEEAGDTPPSVEAYARGIAAEMAVRLGEEPQARKHFQKGLARVPKDPVLLGAWADLELAAGNPEQVLKMFPNNDIEDVLLLRRALALKALKAPGVGFLSLRLLKHHQSARAAGDRSHLREEARLELELLNRVHPALRAARENFTQQKELEDLAILLQAAKAANDSEAAKPALDFIAEHELEDVRLAPLVAAFETP